MSDAPELLPDADFASPDLWMCMITREDHEAALIEAERRGMIAGLAKAAVIASKHNAKYFAERYETTHKRKTYTWYQADSHANTRLNIISEDIEAAIRQAAAELGAK